MNRLLCGNTMLNDVFLYCDSITIQSESHLWADVILISVELLKYVYSNIAIYHSNIAAVLSRQCPYRTLNKL